MKENQFNTIIIGSGVSGMTAAIIQAKEGEKVLVLEQHKVAGGLTQTYKRNGLIFPTGVHRLGSLAPNQPLWHYFNYLGLLDKLDLVPLSPTCFEKFHFPDKTYEVPQGHDAFEQKLILDFPNRKKSISRYFKDLKNVIANINLYDPKINPKKDVSLQYTGCLDSYFKKIGIQGQLKSLLCANNPLHGLSSSQCPVLTHFIICDSYLNASFRINETKTPFAGALAQCLKTHGGKIRTNCHVKTIIVKDKKACGVRLATGELLLSDKVIYSGPPSLLPNLCPQDAFRPVYKKRLQNAKHTGGMFGVAMGWEKSNCPVAVNDAYIYNSWDVNAHYKQQTLGEKNPPEMVFLSALPPADGASKEELAVTALMGINHEEFQKIQESYGEDDKKIYNATKKKLAEKIMEKISKVYPDARHHARIIDTYSPATFARYTLSPEGSAYGIKKTAQNFLEGMFHPATRIKNLFLTGQSIGFSGIHGSIIASFNLCSTLYGKSYLTDKILNQAGSQQPKTCQENIQ
ncbi:MAG: NAD(P)/FAD-dependent oxidoreductase [Desulfobacteraceae bacterium]|nr:NAD(P)/FAD-dependent oxidoreductase [Desulfobacteraceae bacterium]